LGTVDTDKESESESEEEIVIDKGDPITNHDKRSSENVFSEDINSKGKLDYFLTF
jgi:hypothetical protein